MNRINTIMLVSLLASWPTSIVSADEPSEQPPETESDVAEPDPDADFALLIGRLPRYVMTTAGEDEEVEEFTLLEEPLQRWSNPLRSTTKDAGTFLWTHQGRPAVILGTYWAQGSDYIHEFQTLHSGPMVATFGEQEVWVPQKAGVTFLPDPGARKVSTRRTVRLAQMRSIASSFKASAGPMQNPKWILRLLREPIYRYDENIEAEGVIDGALFAFALTTDPESLILIEARESEGAEPTWHVAFARMSMIPQFVEYKDEVVWNVTSAQRWKRTNSYFTKKINSNNDRARNARNDESDKPAEIILRGFDDAVPEEVTVEESQTDAVEVK